MKHFVCYILVFLVGAAAGMLLSRFCHKTSPETEKIVQTDTLTIRDTIVERQPVFVAIEKVDTMLIAIRDTVTVHDTSYAVVDREQKHYRGDDYDAWVSGYSPRLDSIRVFPETKYITKETISAESRKRWGLGIQAGIGGTIHNGRIMAVPYIGVGISYNLIRW